MTEPDVQRTDPSGPVKVGELLDRNAGDEGLSPDPRDRPEEFMKTLFAELDFSVLGVERKLEENAVEGVYICAFYWGYKFSDERRDFGGEGNATHRS